MAKASLRGKKTMEARHAYEDVLARAETLPPEELAKLISALSRFLHEKHGKWTALTEVEEVRDYLEWIRFRDSHHSDGRPKSPEEFLAELGESE
jgi:hypothetical protein